MDEESAQEYEQWLDQQYYIYYSESESINLNK